jgi:hypothetical protein
VNSIGVSSTSGSPSIAVSRRPAVAPISLANRKELERVRVVRDEHDARADRLAVDRDAERLPVLHEDRERAQARERVAAAPMALPPVHEPRVNPEGDVVQKEPSVRTADVNHALLAVHECVERADRVVAVETEVAREVVARSERDAHERQSTFQRDLGDRRE